MRDHHFKKELKFKWGKDDNKKLLPLPYRDGTDMLKKWGFCPNYIMKMLM